MRTRRSQMEMKMGVLEVLAEEASGINSILQRTGLCNENLNPILADLEGMGLISIAETSRHKHFARKKWVRRIYSPTTLGLRAISEWRIIASLLNEPPVLRPVLVAW